MIEHFADYKAQLVRLSEEHTIAFKEEMQEAFEHGFKSHCHENVDADDDSNLWQVLPDKDFHQSLEAEGAEAYEAISEDGQRVGGAIITANGNMGEPMEQREQSDACISSAESRQRKTVGQLAFLYVKVGVQSKGIGQSIWKAIEAMHPEIEVWETCTPFSTAGISTSTSTVADSMPLSSSTSIIQTPICLSSLIRKTTVSTSRPVCLSLRKE